MPAVHNTGTLAKRVKWQKKGMTKNGKVLAEREKIDIKAAAAEKKARETLILRH